jgi:hypothetical protein
MENASKALIIAGAILLSILIISLGIMIYRQAAGVVNQSSMDEVAVQTFNNKFTQYGTTNVRGANVNALLEAIVQNNISNASDSSKQIKVTQSGANWQSTGTQASGSVVTAMPKQALTGKTYTVTYTADTTTGYITDITIQ